jgi:hypothetical protein
VDQLDAIRDKYSTGDTTMYSLGRLGGRWVGLSFVPSGSSLSL